MASRAWAAPSLVRSGYALAKVSTGVPASEIPQLAFRPGDPAHLYAARTSGVITRYDYDPGTGQISNALDVAAAPRYTVHGLAFHGSDLYVALNAPPLSRLTRFSSPDASGLDQTRHDFVHTLARIVDLGQSTSPAPSAPISPDPSTTWPTRRSG